VANGHYLELDQLSDPTFAQKMLGDGFAIDPTDGNIVSPVDGEVTTVFPTKHAIGFKTAGGLEVLLHMGLDTVELKGAGFDVQVADGDKVKHGQLVAKVDLESIKAAGKQTPMIVIITNMDAVGLLKYNAVKDPIADDAKVLTATTK
jgi:PTS system N-acetylglucosamine-specific IIC component